MTGLLLHDAELGGRTGVDVRVEGGLVVEVGTSLGRRPEEARYDCRGGALLPGLCDHHLHLHALAAWSTSVRCGPPEVTGPAALATALASAIPDGHGWIRGVGYAETVAGELDAAALDRLRADRPVRVQHRSGALWTLNTAAMSATGLAGADHPGVERDGRGSPTGRLWRADDWLRSRLPPAGPPDLAQVGAALTRFGITAVTDASPDLDAVTVTAITEAIRGGALPQRVHLLGAPLDTPASGHEDDPAGPPYPAVGPYKIVIADSGLPALDELTDRIRAAHAAGRPVAVHCVTREALVLLLVALDDAGPLPGDRVEHAALVPAELMPEMVRLGLRVVTQPGFLAHRGDDFLRDVPARDHSDLYRGAAFVRAGVPLALSSDAPYGPLDPWAVIAAATRRRTPSGLVAGPDERLTFSQALDAYLAPPGEPGGAPRRIRPGTPADLVVLRTRLAGVPADPEPVRAVLIRGRLVWDRPGAGTAAW